MSAETFGGAMIARSTCLPAARPNDAAASRTAAAPGLPDPLPIATRATPSIDVTSMLVPTAR
jgi:hypothetical protein